MQDTSNNQFIDFISKQANAITYEKASYICSMINTEKNIAVQELLMQNVGDKLTNGEIQMYDPKEAKQKRSHLASVFMSAVKANTRIETDENGLDTVYIDVTQPDVKDVTSSFSESMKMIMNNALSLIMDINV